MEIHNNPVHGSSESSHRLQQNEGKLYQPGRSSPNKVKREAPFSRHREAVAAFFGRLSRAVIAKSERVVSWSQNLSFSTKKIAERTSQAAAKTHVVQPEQSTHREARPLPMSINQERAVDGKGSALKKRKSSRLNSKRWGIRMKTSR